MDSMEINKIVAAVLVGMLMIMFINTFTESAMHVEGPEKVAFPVKLAEATTTDTEAAPVLPSILDLMQTASADRGARLFGRCRACHTLDKGGRNGTGPNLYGVMGAAIGGKDGFNYSSALAEKGGNWTYEMMDAWLQSPKLAIPGNRMQFAGLGRAEQRANLIAYLREQADAPIPLPEVTVEDAVEAVTDAVEAAVTEGEGEGDQ